MGARWPSGFERREVGEGGRQAGRQAGREGGREGMRGGREGGKEGEGGREGGREGRREGGRDGQHEFMTALMIGCIWHGLNALQGTRAKPGNHLVSYK